MNDLTLRARVYRLVFCWAIHPLVSRFFFHNRRLSEVKLGSSLMNGRASRQTNRDLAWFHAASAGELESLWPVVMEWATKRKRLIVSVFSASALYSLRNLEQEISKIAHVEILSGFSPGEGAWEGFLMAVKPSVFITSKYEAWPDLWMSLARLDIPLVVVGAKDRSSFRICKRILALLGMKAPKLFMLTASGKDIVPLRRLFVHAQVQEVGDPRWDRVNQRSLGNSPRVKEIYQGLQDLQRPWGVLGQVWKEDYLAWGDALKDFVGTVWVVPHQVNEHAIEEAIEFIKKNEGHWVKTSNQAGSSHHRCKFVLLDEMGVLSELYQFMDWAYVGGGFGRGVHSTIEPAIYGLPLAAGSVGSEKFEEIAQLSSFGQLTLIRKSKQEDQEQELKKWLDRVSQGDLTIHQQWRNRALECLGSTQKVMSWIEDAAQD